MIKLEGIMAVEENDCFPSSFGLRHSSWRPNFNPFSFQTLPQRTRKLDRTGRIAVQTNSFRAHSYIVAVDGANLSFL